MRKRNLHRILLLSILLLLFSREEALPVNDGDQIAVSSEVDHAFSTIGERITYQLTIRHKPEIKITKIDISETLKDFEIKEDHDFKETEQNTVSEGKRIVLTSYSIGEYVLVPAKITYLDTKGKAREMPSNKLYLSVESVDKNQKPSEDIAAIKGVVNFSYFKPGWLIGFVITLVIFAGLWVWHARKKRRSAAGEQEPLLEPHEEAYQALDRLFDSDFIKRGQYKVYYSTLSEVIRRYLERRYQFLALESTTEEVAEKLKQISMDTNVKMWIRNLLEACDLVKFAKYQPAPSEIIQDNARAKNIIDQTKLLIPAPDSSQTEVTKPK